MHNADTADHALTKTSTDEWPQQPSRTSRPWHLLTLAADTPAALNVATAQFVEYLKDQPESHLADIAYTLNSSHQKLDACWMMVCQDSNDAIKVLQTRDLQRLLFDEQPYRSRPVIFMFPGLGDHYVHMAWQIYQHEPTFCKWVDQCSAYLKPLLGQDLRAVLYPLSAKPPQADIASRIGQQNLQKLLRRDQPPTDTISQQLTQTSLCQPALFIIEYALARLLMDWGIHPQAMIGYSLGEYVAACLAGVFSLEDALMLVARRAQLLQALPPGSMLAVSLSEEEVQPFLNAHLSLAAVNGPSLSVVSGTKEAITELERTLTARRIATRYLQTSHAFHSCMMDPIVGEFTRLISTIPLQQPQLPYISNVTGTWITPSEATEPAYWATHLCKTVRFADGLRELWSKPEHILLEVGPGQTLSSLAMQHPAGRNRKGRRFVLPTIRNVYDAQPDLAFLLNTAGRLWLAGASLDWSGFYSHRHVQPVQFPEKSVLQKRSSTPANERDS